MSEQEPWGQYSPNVLARLCILALRRRIVRGALKAPVRKLLTLFGPQYDVEVDGLRMRCRMDDNFTEQMAIERSGHTNRTGVALITSNLNEGDVFVDVGANCGFYTLFAARAVGPTGRVIAAEPLPEMTQRLRFNVAANGFANVTVCETAIGETTGTAGIVIGEQEFGQTSLCGGGEVLMQVSVRPLLAIIEDEGIGSMGALKIDIEGFEDRALLPFIRTAPRHLWPRRILMEVEQADLWNEDCLAALLAAGYQERWRSASDVLLQLQTAQDDN